MNSDRMELLLDARGIDVCVRRLDGMTWINERFAVAMSCTKSRTANMFTQRPRMVFTSNVLYSEVFEYVQLHVGFCEPHLFHNDNFTSRGVLSGN